MIDDLVTTPTPRHGRTLNDVPTLSIGSHADPAEGMCAMEAAAWLAGEEHSDSPECVCPVLAVACRRANDDGDDTVRERLRSMLPVLIGTRSAIEIERRRAYVLTDTAVRVLAPATLDTAGLGAEAERLRALPPVVDQATARAAADAADAAAEAAALAAFYAFYAPKAACVAAYVAADANAVDAAEAAADAAFYATKAAKAANGGWMTLLDAVERAAKIRGE